MVRRVAEAVFVPFTVGGGIRTLDDATRLIQAGAEKVSINSAAVRNPELITAIARKFGRCATVVNIEIAALILETACARHSTESCVRLARLHRSGILGRKDTKLANTEAMPCMNKADEEFAAARDRAKAELDAVRM